MSQYYKIVIYNNENLTNPVTIASSQNNAGILSPQVDKEINTAGSFSFTVLPTHPQWANGFNRMKTIVDVIIRDTIVFRGRITEITSDNYKQKSITCEGALAWLIDNYRPKSKDILENMMAFKSVVSSELDDYNTLMENYKRFTVGTCEPAGYSGNLIPEASILDNSYYSKTDGVTIVSDNSYVCSSEYVSFSQSKTYKLYVKTYKSSDSATSIFYCYGTGRAYLGNVSGSTLTKAKITEAGMDATSVKTIRVAGKGNRSGMFWLTTLDDEVEETDDNEWGGGNYGDFMVNWINDAQHMIMRSRSVGTTNYIDILNPNKVTSNVSSSNSTELLDAPTITFADNLLNLSTESVEIEPYSIIYPIFEGEAYPSAFPTVQIPNAVTAYGKIVKEIDFGKKPSSSSDSLYQKRLNKIKSLYDPSIPNSFTVTALDKRMIFDNDEWSLIDVGDIVKLVSAPHSVNVALLCLSLKLDIYNPSNNQYKIGQYVDGSTNSRIETLTESFTRNKN